MAMHHLKTIAGYVRPAATECMHRRRVCMPATGCLLVLLSMVIVGGAGSGTSFRRILHDTKRSVSEGTLIHSLVLLLAHESSTHSADAADAAEEELVAGVADEKLVQPALSAKRLNRLNHLAHGRSGQTHRANGAGSGRRSDTKPPFSMNLLLSQNVSAVVRREIKLATALGLAPSIRAAMSDAASHTTRGCFNPLSSNLTAARTGSWEQYRIAAAMVDGDPHLAVYQDVFVGAACSSASIDPSHVVVATHMTANSMPLLIDLVNRWSGCVSVAVHACAPSDIRTIEQHWQNSEALRRWVTLHFVLGGEGPYPVNILRNVALEPWQRAFAINVPLPFRAFTAVRPEMLPWQVSSSCTTRRAPRSRPAHAGSSPRPDSFAPWLFTLDVDSLPSVSMAGVSAALDAAIRERRRGYTFQESLFAVLSFEPTGPAATEAFRTLSNASIASNVDWLLQQARGHRVRVLLSNKMRAAYLGHVPLSTWITTRFPVLPVDYVVHHEPFFVAKPPFPRFDEYFRGPGYAKSSWFFSHCIDGQYDIAQLGQVYTLQQYVPTPSNSSSVAVPRPRRENAIRMSATIADAIRDGRVCHKFENERTVKLVAENLAKRLGADV